MRKGQQAFALVLTVVLLGLLLLIALGLASLARTGSDAAMILLSGTQARQNALVGFRVALGELQRLAGSSATDAYATGMGGIGGAATNATTRQWTAVWDASGVRLAWLASGADQSAVAPTLLSGHSPVTIVGTNTVGTSAEDREQVTVGREPIQISTSTPAATNVNAGGYAYWVGDEGVKVSLSARNGSQATPLVRPDPLFPATKPPLAANIPNVLIFEQTKFAPATTLTNTQRQNMYHTLTVRHTRVAGGTEIDGVINLNSTSATLWKQLLDAYNNNRGAGDPAISSTTAAANRFRDQISSTTNANKATGGPFRTVGDLGLGNFLATALGDTTTNKPSTRFLAVMGGALTVRSDTFRIRAYGDSVNPATGSIESQAYCEAIVQRKDFPLPTGRRFVVQSFRWLTPDDI